MNNNNDNRTSSTSNISQSGGSVDQSINDIDPNFIEALRNCPDEKTFFNTLRTTKNERFFVETLRNYFNQVWNPLDERRKCNVVIVEVEYWRYLDFHGLEKKSFDLRDFLKN